MLETKPATALLGSPPLAESSSPNHGIWPKLGLLVAELSIAFSLGWGFSWLQLGGLVWMFAGMIAAAGLLQLWRWRWHNPPAPNRQARKVGLALVGLTIGCGISNTDVQATLVNLPVYMLLTGILLVSGLGTGYLYAHLRRGGTVSAAMPDLENQTRDIARDIANETSRHDRQTEDATNYLEALLATIPGGVGVMAGLAAEYGCNVTQVALVQIMRVSSIIVLIPFLAGLISGQGLNPRRLLPHQDWFPLAPEPLLLLGIALGLTAVMVRIMQLTRLPVAPFLGGLLAGGCLQPLLAQAQGWAQMLPPHLPAFSDWLAGGLATPFSPPPLVGYMGQMLLGLTIGEYWASHLGDRRAWQRRDFFPALLCVGLTLATGFAGAGLAFLLTPWDWLTCLLVTAPGGAPEMILVALALHHPIETITTGHVVRLVGINCSLPLWLWLAPRLSRWGKPVE
jgi:uncharacterized protein